MLREEDEGWDDDAGVARSSTDRSGPGARWDGWAREGVMGVLAGACVLELMGNEGADWDRDGVAVRSLLDPSSCGVIPDPCARDEVREAEACGGGVEGFCVRGRAVF